MHACLRRLLPILLTIALLAGVSSPAEAFDDDVHLFLTYYLARVAGFTSAQALEIARADANADRSKRIAAFDRSNPLSALLDDPDHDRARIAFHAFRDGIKFPKGADGVPRAAKAEIDARRDALEAHARRLGNPGLLLHFVQDAVSHDWQEYEHQAGHGADGKLPDYLSYKPERAQVVWQETLEYLTRFRRFCCAAQAREATENAAAIRDVVNKLIANSSRPTPGLRLYEPTYKRDGARSIVLNALLRQFPGEREELSLREQIDQILDTFVIDDYSDTGDLLPNVVRSTMTASVGIRWANPGAARALGCENSIRFLASPHPTGLGGRELPIPLTRAPSTVGLWFVGVPVGTAVIAVTCKDMEVQRLTERVGPGENIVTVTVPAPEGGQPGGSSPSQVATTPSVPIVSVGNPPGPSAPGTPVTTQPESGPQGAASPSATQPPPARLLEISTIDPGQQEELWVLTKTVEGKRRDDFPRGEGMTYEKHFAPSARSATYSTKDMSGPTVLSDWQYSFSWNEPPKYLRPKDTFTISGRGTAGGSKMEQSTGTALLVGEVNGFEVKSNGRSFVGNDQVQGRLRLVSSASWSYAFTVTPTFLGRKRAYELSLMNAGLVVRYEYELQTLLTVDIEKALEPYRRVDPSARLGTARDVPTGPDAAPPPGGPVPGAPASPSTGAATAAPPPKLPGFGTAAPPPPATSASTATSSTTGSEAASRPAAPSSSITTATNPAAPIATPRPQVPVPASAAPYTNTSATAPPRAATITLPTQSDPATRVQTGSDPVVIQPSPGRKVTAHPHTTAQLGPDGTTLELNNGVRQGGVAVDEVPDFADLNRASPPSRRVKSPDAQIAPEGTSYQVMLRENGTTIEVFEGRVRVTGRVVVRTNAAFEIEGTPSPQQELILNAGERAIAFREGYPVPSGTPRPAAATRATPLPGFGPGPSTAAPTSVTPPDPGTPQIQAYIDEWLRTAIPAISATRPGRWQYSRWGTLLGPGAIQAASPDSFSYERIWRNRAEYDSLNVCSLEEFVLRRLANRGLDGCARGTPLGNSAATTTADDAIAKARAQIAQQERQRQAAARQTAEPTARPPAEPAVEQRAVEQRVAVDRNQKKDAAPDFAGTWRCTTAESASGTSDTTGRITDQEQIMIRRTPGGYEAVSEIHTVWGLRPMPSTFVQGNRVRFTQSGRRADDVEVRGTFDFDLQNGGATLVGSAPVRLTTRAGVIRDRAISYSCARGK